MHKRPREDTFTSFLAHSPGVKKTNMWMLGLLEESRKVWPPLRVSSGSAKQEFLPL